MLLKLKGPSRWKKACTRRLCAIHEVKLPKIH